VTLSPSTERREAGSPQPARRRLGRRLSATHVVIAIVVILAFVLNLLVLQDRSSTTLVAVADRALATGSAMDQSSIRLVPVDSDFEGLPGLVTEDDLGSLDDWVLARPVPAGNLLDRTALVRPGSGAGLRSMSLPVPVEHAAGGALAPGDRVDVIAVTDGVADFVAVDLEVTTVSEAGSGAIGTISAYHVVVNVEPADALRLAEALAAGPVEIVRATGADRIERGDGDS
jgi:Flp pilus assembly protein CpaB